MIPQSLGAPLSSLVKVLLVEADDEAAERARRALSAVGLGVDRIPFGELATSRARALRPSLVVLADALPELSGFTVCDRLRAVPGIRELPILVLVGPEAVGAAEAHRLRETRADAYLPRGSVGAALARVASSLIAGLGVPQDAPALGAPAPTTANATSEAPSSLWQAVEPLQQAMREGKERVTLLEDQLATTREEQRGLEGANQRLTRELDFARRELADSRRHAGELLEQVERLHKATWSAEDKMGRRQAEVLDFGRALSGLRDENRALRIELAAFKGREPPHLAATAREDTEEQKALQTLSTELETALAESERRRAESEARLSEELNSARSALETRTAELSALQATRAELASVAPALDAERNRAGELETALRESIRRAESAEELSTAERHKTAEAIQRAEALAAQLESAQARLGRLAEVGGEAQGLREDLARAGEQLSEARAALADRDARLQALTSELEGARQAIEAERTEWSRRAEDADRGLQAAREHGARLEEAVADNAARTGAAESALAEARQSLQQLEQGLAADRARLFEFQQALAERDRLLAERDAEIAHRDQALQLAQVQLAKAQGTAAEQQSLASALMAARAELEAERSRALEIQQAVAERDRLLAERDAEIGRRDQELRLSQGQLVERERTLGEVERRLAESDAALRGREAALDEARAEIGHLKEAAQKGGKEEQVEFELSFDMAEGLPSRPDEQDRIPTKIMLSPLALGAEEQERIPTRVMMSPLAHEESSAPSRPAASPRPAATARPVAKAAPAPPPRSAPVRPAPPKPAARTAAPAKPAVAPKAAPKPAPASKVAPLPAKKKA